MKFIFSIILFASGFVAAKSNAVQVNCKSIESNSGSKIEVSGSIQYKSESAAAEVSINSSHIYVCATFTSDSCIFQNIRKAAEYQSYGSKNEIAHTFHLIGQTSNLAQFVQLNLVIPNLGLDYTQLNALYQTNRSFIKSQDPKGQQFSVDLICAPSSANELKPVLSSIIELLQPSTLIKYFVH